MDYDIVKYINFISFALYLIFIFLAIQIWLLWKDINKDEMKIKTISEPFFKKNFAYVLSFSMFFMFRELTGGTLIYSETFGMLALIGLVLFAYEWYGVLRAIAPKKSLPRELTGAKP